MHAFLWFPLACTLAPLFVLAPVLPGADTGQPTSSTPGSKQEGFTQPTNDKEWRKIKSGTTQVVELCVSESHTRIVLKEGQSVRIVPHPDDRWFISMEGQNQTPVGWQGEAGKGPARSKKLQVMVYPDNKTQGKPVTDESKKSPLSHWWSDIGDLDNNIWTGPGELVFRGEFGSDYRGAGKGAIRVKIVPIKDAAQTTSK